MSYLGMLLNCFLKHTILSSLNIFKLLFLVSIALLILTLTGMPLPLQRSILIPVFHEVIPDLLRLK